MNSGDIALVVVGAAMAVWVVTHTIAVELTPNWPKPFSCQLCMSGWICIISGGALSVLLVSVFPALITLSIWGLTVFFEAWYKKLNTHYIP